MALVLRNNNLALSKVAKKALQSPAVAQVGTIMGKLIWNGVQWVSKKAYNRMLKRKDIVAHPGTLPGAIAAPVAITRQIVGSRPRFRKGTGSVTVTHRELIGSFSNNSTLLVNGGVTGNVYRVNPSNGNLFTWLNTLAANFDQYKFDSLALHYVPLCATTETGRFAMYFDKDSQDTEPADRIELANTAHLKETAPWAEAILNIPVDNIKRFTNDSNTSDPKLLDLGQVGVAVYGGSTSNVVGDVFITYTITFFEPQPSAGLVQTLQTGTGATNYGPNYVVVVDTTTSSVITFRSPGVYLVSQNQRDTSFTSVTIGANLLLNSNLLLQSGTSAYMAVYNVTAQAPGATLTFNGVGFGNRTTHVVRARVGNNANLI